MLRATPSLHDSSLRPGLTRLLGHTESFQPSSGSQAHPPGEEAVPLSPESPTQPREDMLLVVFCALHLEPRVGQPVSRAKNHKLGGVRGPGIGSPMEAMVYVFAPLVGCQSDLWADAERRG